MNSHHSSTKECFNDLSALDEGPPLVIFPLLQFRSNITLVLSIVFTFALGARGVHADNGDSARDWSRPAAYSEFRTIESASELVKVIAAEKERFLYLPEGIYSLPNPVVISRNVSLVIHGASEETVIIHAENPGEPLFVVEDATLVQFSNLRLRPDSKLIRDSIALRTRSVDSANVELLGVAIDKSRIEVAGSGRLLCENCAFRQNGISDAVVVDHPEADVTLVGGDISNATERSVGRISREHYHAWQKRGRLRIYGTTTEATLGQADFRFDTTSGLGPHILADVRSEGANGKFSVYPHALAYVPPAAPVDLVIKNASLAFGPEWGAGSAVLYNGTGTLWIYGLTGVRVSQLVGGDTSNATLVVAGTVSFSDRGQFPPVVARLFEGENLHNYECFSGAGQPPWPGGVDTRCSFGSRTPPKARMLKSGRRLESHGVIPAPPRDELPKAVPFPVMDVKLKGFKDVVSDFGAVGDGVKDDTAALQTALDWQCRHGKGATLLWFPKGTYRTTSRLRFNSATQICHDLPSGAFIAGAGRDLTKIIRSGGRDGGVFRSDGFAFSRIQGITFEADRGASSPVFSIEWEGLGQPASQQSYMDDVRFVGGAMGWATGVETEKGQCSSFIVRRAEIRNSGIGFAVGHFNALANICLSCELVDNDHAFGHATLIPGSMAGGTLYLYDVRSSGTKVREFTSLQGHSDSIFGFRGYQTDAPAWVHDGVWQSGGSALVQFEQATIAPRGNSVGPMFDWGSAGGIIFIDSTITRFSANLNSQFNAGYLLSLYSQIEAWSSIVRTGDHARTDRVEKRP